MASYVEVESIFYAAIVLMTWSWLYKGDNPFYKIIEHATIGLFLAVSAQGVIQAIQTRIVGPLTVGALFPALPFLMLGIFTLTRMVPKLRFMSIWVIALMSGVGTGVAVKGVVIPMIIKQTIINPWTSPNIFSNINNVLVWVATITTLIYFVYSIKREAFGGVVRVLAEIGRIFMMLGFGVVLAGFLFVAGINVTGVGTYLVQYPGYYVTAIGTVILIGYIIWSRNHQKK